MLSNNDLIRKCRQFLLSDISSTAQDELIKSAIITAFREINEIGMMPLEWNKEIYDELFTRYYAEISAITAADPGVITAESTDPDLDDNTGFSTDDIVYIEGINGEDSRSSRLNNRFYRWVAISDTTGSLKSLNGNTEINTTNYDTYDSGGVIYHAGIVLPASTIEPSGGSGYNTSYEWTIKRVYDLTFDMCPTNPISEEKAKLYLQPGGRPRMWRYQRYAYGSFANNEHLLFWYNFPSVRYNVKVHLEKEYPEPSKWGEEVFLPCPSQIHEYVWHRALSKLAMDSEKHRRKTATKDNIGDNTKIEILNANYWISLALEEEMKIKELSRKLSGDQPYMSQGMSA
jgi:hypothetical protein